MSNYIIELNYSFKTNKRHKIEITHKPRIIKIASEINYCFYALTYSQIYFQGL